MDDESAVQAAMGAPQDTTSEPEPMPSLAPPSSTSLLSDAPTTDPLDAADHQAKQSTHLTFGSLPPETAADPSSSGPVDQSQHGNTANATATNPPGWEAAKEQMMKDMASAETKTNQPSDGPPTSAKRGGRGGKRVSIPDGNPTPNKLEGDAAQATPTSSGRGGRGGRPRGRGRGGGRPRGRGRGGGRGGKRKREDGSDGESSGSEVATPMATMTKSGRNVQKPTSFVPPPPSPTTTTKRKRTYRRNPESAVCKMCLRGTSPASNMIVFCDGCNTPYHRYCHQPPIEQAVIDEVDKEWYCQPCEKERIVPVPEAEVASFVSAAGAGAEQRQKYFASLPPGMLVTLLTKATTLKPDLPLFGPDFEARTSTTTAVAGATPQATPTNGIQPQLNISQPAAPRMLPSQTRPYADDPRYPVPDEHPAHYVRPGQGLMRNLPPEQEDSQHLVDADPYRVFSHYHIDPQGAGAGASAGQGTGMGMGMEQAGPGA